MLEARSGHRLAASTISRKHVFCTRLLASGSEYAISIARSLFAPETNFLNPSTGIPLPNAYGINQKSKDHCGSHIDSLIEGTSCLWSPLPPGWSWLHAPIRILRLGSCIYLFPGEWGSPARCTTS